MIKKYTSLDYYSTYNNNILFYFNPKYYGYSKIMFKLYKYYKLFYNIYYTYNTYYKTPDNIQLDNKK
jgi:hypothetical protein